MARTVHIGTHEGRGGSAAGRSMLLVIATGAAACAFALVGSARGVEDPPPVTLGPRTEAPHVRRAGLDAADLDKEDGQALAAGRFAHLIRSQVDVA